MSAPSSMWSDRHPDSHGQCGCTWETHLTLNEQALVRQHREEAAKVRRAKLNEERLEALKAEVAALEAEASWK